MAAYVGATHSGNASLVDDLETSFQALFSALVGQDNVNIVDQDEIKTGIEQATQKFIDVSKEIEAFFLQKRLLLSTHRPEQVIKEDIDDLRTELARKEALIHKLQTRVQHWQELLGSFPSCPVPGRVKQDVPSVSTSIGAASTVTALVAAQQAHHAAQQQQQQHQPQTNVGTPPVGTPTGHPSSSLYMGPLAQLEQAASQVSTSFERR
ncbi:mediator of RNA polymerase II transcription subunit 28-like [Ptychodera flava]|uniref:mediator of RNA polymerase II transcription subunit 28-like n=1 Tax=Ptychodera flava TaxID=63121 RepID=UPI003969BCAD